MTVREYLIGVMAAALLCGIVKSLLPGNGTMGSVIKVLLGILMILAVVRPWVTLELDSFLNWKDGVTMDAQSIVSNAQSNASETVKTRIKEECEAYILAKAEVLGAEVEVLVVLSDEMPVKPVGVTVRGPLSPFAKQKLSDMMTQELGIKEDAQEWIG